VAAAVTPYICRPRVRPDEHKLRTSVSKPMNVIRNTNVSPDEHKKTDEQCLFPIVKNNLGYFLLIKYVLRHVHKKLYVLGLSKINKLYVLYSRQ
jgi:hypothetical protein